MAYWRRVAMGTFAGAALLHLVGPVARESGYVAAAVLVAFGVAILWRPELSLALALNGYTVVVGVLPDTRLRFEVAVLLMLFAVTGVAVTLRHLVRDRAWRRTRTPLDMPVTFITLYGIFSTLLGFLRGHDPSLVVFSSYHVLQWPVYYLIVTYTLNRPERLGVSWALDGSLDLGSSLASIITRARTGAGAGWLSIALALSLLRKPVVGRGWLALVLLASTFNAVRGGHRTVWVGIAISVLWLAAVSATRRHGRLLAISVGVFLVALTLVGLFTRVPALRHTDIGWVVARSFERGAGYRFSEAQYGWRAFLESPIIGQGFGQREEGAWIPELARYGGGPVYHMFHLIILANQGLVGMLLVLWLQGRALFGREGAWLRERCADHPWAAVGLALQAQTVGSFVAALFAGPRISHFEWITNPTLSLLCAQWAMADLRNRQGDPECPAQT